MRIFAAGLSTETNTFSPLPTGIPGFETGGLYRGVASVSGSGTGPLAARTFRDLAQADRHVFVEGLFAQASPSGETLTAVYERLRDEILAEIAAKGPFDVVLLFLHGAMVAVDYQDCEADLAARVRAIVGPATIIGVELDPHCHLSQDLIEAADCVVIVKEYPHDDYAERAADLYRICTRAAAGDVKPVSALFDCRMIGFYPTGAQPMRGLVDALFEAEKQPRVLSASLAHGFPWGDVWDVGTKALVITDNDRALAAGLAERIGRSVYQRRGELLPRYPDMSAALDEAAALQGLVVLGDTADNPGGGAPGDNPAFLRLLLERRITAAAVGCLWDPMAVAACAEAGPGARFPLRVGGKTGPASGDPLDVMATVRAVREGHDQAGLGGARSHLGLSAWITCDGIEVVLCSLRSQTFSPEAFTGLGVPLEALRLVVVKSSNHYRARFAALTPHLINVATPGAIQMNFADIPYRRRRPEPYFPKDPDPLGVV